MCHIVTTTTTWFHIKAHALQYISSVKMRCRKSDIVGILDMDGFQIGGNFYCKELGLVNVGSEKATSYFFDIGIRWHELTAKDRRTCGYVIRKVHKLPFGVPYGWKALPLEQLPAIVQEFFARQKQNGKSCLAYKGGHLERDLLWELRIPSVNLEDFGCPKAEKLFDQLSSKKNMWKTSRARCLPSLCKGRS